MKKFAGVVLFLLLISNVFSFHSPASASDDITGISLENEKRAMNDKNRLEGLGNGIKQPNASVTNRQFARYFDIPGTKGPFNFSYAASINAKLKKAVGYSVKDENTKRFDNKNRMNSLESNKKASHAAFLYRMLNTAKRYASEQPGKEKPDIGEKTTDKGGEKLNPGEEKPNGEMFGKSGYRVSTISNGSLVPGSKLYSSFIAAENAVANLNQVVTLDDQIMKMSTGLVISKPANGQATTRIYSDSDFKKEITLKENLKIICT